MARNPIKYPYASGTTNKMYPTTQSEIEAGTPLKANIRSNDPNGIANFEQTAIRDLQTAGALYDNEQIYNAGDYVSVLISEGAITRILYFRCKQANTTQKPPITGTNGGTTDRPVLSNPVFANPNYWERVLFETRNLVTFSNSEEKNIVLIGDASKDNVFGTLNVKLKGSGSDSYDCVFDIEFFGKATEFRIKNVYYSKNIRNSNNLCGGVQIGHGGFFIEINQGKMYLAVKNPQYCQDMEFDFSKLNCIVIPSTSAYSITKPYAIIEGGGVIREGLGELIYNQREWSDAQSGETYDFFLFKNGYIEYTTAITLDSTIYHQYANGGFASTNIDPSDRVLRNVGINAGYTVGTLLEDAIRNLTASFGALQNNGPVGIGFISNVEGQKMLTSGFAQNRRVTPQEMSQIYGTTITSFDYWESRGLTPQHVNIIELDASQQVNTASENRGKSFTSRLYLKLF